ncbi:8-amino-7-oxononanoate synthase [Aliivibrio kagoshimensis]|uniref:8-amino-7-oxononanoate synthase n=1 Tax=Aliivibrio kagoshimensis TaxID=2910230 RepID=UPI003D138454
MKQGFNRKIRLALDERAEAGLTRCRLPIEHGNDIELSHDGKNYLNFSGNDYLGLANSPELITAWQKGLEAYGTGSGASPLVTGYSLAHLELEQKLADWLGFEKAVLFNSGFSANQAILFSLLSKHDLLLQDKLNHASLMEAGILSPATMKRFAHNDLSHLKRLLPNSEQDALIVTEGVFSMDGDLAPLAELSELMKERSDWLMVDDAHGCGVLGQQGRGSCDLAKIKPDMLVVTFGKAFGLSGAAVLCSEECADYLMQFSKHHVYSTAMPPAQAHTLSKAIDVIIQDEWRREKLLELGNQFEKELVNDCEVTSTQTPIKPLIIGGSYPTVQVATRLKEQGIWTTAIRPPTVPKDTARLRITLSASHTPQQVTQLTTLIKQELKRQ